MKKLLIALMALALLVGAAAAEERVAMRIVSCPEQGFSTLCNPEYDYYFVPDGGLTIELGASDGDPFVTIFKTDAPGADFDAQYYLDHVYVDALRDSCDALVQLNDTAVYTLGGRQLTARMAIYTNDGELRMRFCAYDLLEDCFVQYEAFSAGTDEEMERALKALAVAAGNFQPDADYYSK